MASASSFEVNLGTSAETGNWTKTLKFVFPQTIEHHSTKQADQQKNKQKSEDEAHQMGESVSFYKSEQPYNHR